MFEPDSHSADSPSEPSVPPSSSSSSIPPREVSPEDSPTEINKTPVPGQLADQPTIISSLHASSPHSGRTSPLPSSTRSHDLGLLLEGKLLGDFRLDEFVGGGGMGAVFRAQDMNLGRTVAVKVLSQGRSADNDTLKRFRQEAQSAARLNHNNIARVYYVGEHDGWNYIVFEYIDGFDLREQVVRHGPLSLETALNYTLQVSEALHHAVQRDVVHRDIKPSNVLVTSSGQAKLVDMGLARPHHVESGHEELTVSGVTLGTFDYISPEQARDPRDADVRSDIYSLGCTLFFMLSSRPPFSEGTVLQKLLSHTSDEPPDIRQFRPDIPAPVSLLLNKMLAKSADHRQQSPSQLIGELLLLMDQLGMPPAGGTGAVWVTPGTRPLKTWERLLPWIAAVLLLTATAFFVEHLVHAPNVVATIPDRPKPSPQTVPGQRDGVRPDTVLPEIPSTGPGTPEASPPATFNPSETLSPREQGVENSGSTAVGQQPDSTVPRTLQQERLEEPVEIPGRNSPPEIVTSSEQAERSDEFKESIPDDNSSKKEPLPGPPHQQTLIVDPTTDNARPFHYASLSEALNKLRVDQERMSTSQIIELRYNGVRTETPLVITHPRVTIRAADGFRPVLRFQPQDYEQTSMLTVTSKQLKIVNLQLEFELGQPVEHWSLFDVRHNAGIELDHSTVTIRNGNQGRTTNWEGVAFFHIEPGETSFDETDSSPASSSHPTIRLKNCILRGEATLIWAVEARPLEFSWDNGLFVSTERLLLATGSTRPPQADSNLNVRLSAVTVVADKGLCYLSQEKRGPHLPPVSFQCDGMILLSAPGWSYIQQTVLQEITFSPDKFSLRGKNNLFMTQPGHPGPRAYWTVATEDESPEPRSWHFSEWLQLAGESDWSWQEVPKSTVGMHFSGQAAHKLSAKHYQLDRLTSEKHKSLLLNFWLRRNLTPAGFHLQELPELEVETQIRDAPSTAGPDNDRAARPALLMR